ncbi:hypothetical protein C0J52_08380 [Blattella germanica]|nr:hypothetical protein C0J52_08380 [Blattella germanica]
MVSIESENRINDAVEVLLCEIFKNYKNKRISNVLFCDLTKAFDCIDHDSIISKLSYYGVLGNSLNISRSYLTNNRLLISKMFVPMNQILTMV